MLVLEGMGGVWNVWCAVHAHTHNNINWLTQFSPLFKSAMPLPHYCLLSSLWCTYTRALLCMQCHIVVCTYIAFWHVGLCGMLLFVKHLWKTSSVGQSIYCKIGWSICCKHFASRNLQIAVIMRGRQKYLWRKFYGGSHYHSGASAAGGRSKSFGNDVTKASINVC